MATVYTIYHEIKPEQVPEPEQVQEPQLTPARELVHDPDNIEVLYVSTRANPTPEQLAPPQLRISVPPSPTASTASDTEEVRLSQAHLLFQRSTAQIVPVDSPASQKTKL